MLRQSIQCQSDITLVPFEWKPDIRAPWPNFSTKHQCRDFTKIKDWIREHGEDLKGQLVHPDLGPVPEDLLK